MSRSYWLPIIALGGCLGLGFAFFLPWSNNEYCKAPSAQDRPTTAQQDIKPKSTPAGFSERVARSVEAISQANDPQDKTEREISDLAAQQDMACWAFWMMLGTFAQVFVGMAGIAAVVASIVQGRRALKIGMVSNKAARAAVRVSQNTAKRELRAYLSPAIIKDDPFVWGENLGLILAITNYGSTPAYSLGYRHVASCVLKPMTTQRLSDQIAIMKNKPAIGSITIAPTQTVRIPISVKFMDYSDIDDPTKYLAFAGYITFLDVFKDERFLEILFVCNSRVDLENGKFPMEAEGNQSN